MGKKKKIYYFDKIVMKYQSLTDKEKHTVDLIIKGLALVILIFFIYKAGDVIGEYLYNADVKI